MSTEASNTDRHSAETALIEARKAKAGRMRDAGKNPFSNQLKPGSGAHTFDIGVLRAEAATVAEHDGRFDETKVRSLFSGRAAHVRGRVIALRGTGGLSFIKLRDRTGEIQLLVQESQLGDGYAGLDVLDVGDIIEAEGAVMASKRGELSVDVTRFNVITKSYRPLPEKWHGLQDIETRYRQRYVDLIANPGVADVFKARGVIVSAVRRVLDGEGFLEVETPSMHTLIGGAAAKPFETHHNALDMGLFMRIAPELYLKRLLVGGLERVYEIGRCYRNEGLSTRHNPEFTMLEFYRAYSTYAEALVFGESLIRRVDDELRAKMPESHAVWKAARPFTLDEPFARVPMADAVKQGAIATGIAEWISAVETGGEGLVDLLRGDFVDSIKAWSKSSARAKAIDWGNFRKGYMKMDNDGERLFGLYEYLCEPFLAEDYRSADGTKSLPVFITDYPYETSPLARRNDIRPSLVDRFELFVHGRELCNAFSELNDPDDQAARFREQVEKKSAGAEETMDYDEDYIRALEYGMPPAAGFGMGMDRLVMMLCNQGSIRDVILFPLLRPTAE